MINWWERKVKKDYISWNEKPVTPEEKEVAERIQKFITSYNCKAVEDFMALFAEDAIIESRSGFKGRPILMGLFQFKQSIQKNSPRIEALFVDHISLKMETEGDVLMSSILTSVLKTGKIKSYPFYLTFKKYGKEWLISRNLYS